MRTPGWYTKEKTLDLNPDEDQPQQAVALLLAGFVAGGVLAWVVAKRGC